MTASRSARQWAFLGLHVVLLVTGVVLFQMSGMSKEQAFAVPFLTYLASVLISLIGGLIFVSRPSRRALQAMLDRKKSVREAGTGDHQRRRIGS